MEKFLSILGIMSAFIFLVLGCPSPGGEPETHFVAMGREGQIWWSPDGGDGNWKETDPGEVNTFDCVAFGDGLFAAAGTMSDRLWQSDDGKNWSSISISGIGFYGMCYGDDRFVAVGNSGRACWSADGSEDNWTDSSPGGYSLHTVGYRP
jgi:photosystem II stability/assembly factor-like uncharacterized protein